MLTKRSLVSINLRKARVSGLKRCCLFNKSWKKKKVVWTNNLVKLEHIKLIMGGWVGTTRFTHLDYRKWNHMYTRLYQAPCQLCLTTSLLATDGISHEGPRFFTLVQPWRTSISFSTKSANSGHVKMQKLACNTPLFLVFWPHPEPPKDWKKKIRVFMGNEKCLWTP